MTRWFFALLATLAVMAGAPARAGSPLGMDAFFQRPAISGPEISPSGRYLASIRKRGEGQVVLVEDRETGTEKAVAYTQTDKVGFDWLEWKTDDRLLLRVWLFDVRRARGDPEGRVLGVRYGRYLQAVDRDGGNVVTMFQDTPSGLKSSAAKASYLSLLPNDPDHVLVQAPDGRGMLSVWRANVHTGAVQMVEPGDWRTFGWYVDGDGKVVARYKVSGRTQELEGRDAAGEWRTLVRLPQKEARELDAFEILGPATKPGEVYVAVTPADSKRGEHRGLYAYDIGTKTLSEPKWRPLGYDIESIVYRRGGAELEGVCFTTDVFTCDFKEPAKAARYAEIVRELGEDRNIVVNSASRDGRYWVLAASGANRPGAYYLHDGVTGKLSLIADTQPELKPELLGETRRITYAARDGYEVPAYLTLPPGARAGASPAPLVVMPHGGPETRDYLRYDPLVQYLATRGYAVFQPNFRGSGGYGRTHAEAGYGQWGLLMQNDITDGVKHLIASGQVDPARICIVGASYGGYAALIGGAQTPDLYRCVVSIAGVADLNALLDWQRGEAEDKDDPHLAYWLQSIGDPAKDRERLQKTSAVTYAATYAPPVLLVHGEDDDVVPVEQSKIMERALKGAGKRVTLSIFKQEGHSAFSERHERLLYSQIEDFLGKYIGAPRAGS